jgi:hypothetical protein
MGGELPAKCEAFIPDLEKMVHPVDAYGFLKEIG